MEDMSSRIRFGGPFGYGGGGGGGVRSFRRRLKVYSPAFLEAIGKGDLAITVENGDKAVFPNNVLADVSEILARQQDGSALIFEVTSFVAAPSPSPSKPETDGKTNAPEPSHQQTTSSRTSSSDDSHSATTGTASSIVNDSLASDTNATSALLPATNTAAIAQSSSSTISASPPPIPTHRRTHIGVLEFSGEQRNVAYLPLWIMRGLKVNDGDEVLFVSRSLPPVSYLRLQPTDNSFFTSVTDPKLALEDALRNFTAVTEGDLLHISLLGSSIREEDESQNFFGRGHSSNYRQGRGGEGGGGLFEDNSPLGRASSSSSRIFVFKVLEVKPKNASKAASVVTADCEIQFEKNTNVGRDEEIGGGGGGGGFGGIDSFISSSTSLSRGVSDHAISDSLQQTNNSNFNTSSLTGRNTPTSSSSSDQHHHHQYSCSSNNEFADPVKLEASIGGAAPVRGVLTHGRGGGGYNRPGRAFFTIFVRDPACDILRVLLTCEGGENTDDSGTLNNAGGSGSISSSYGAMRSGSARGDDSMRESISRSKEAYFAQMLPDEPSLSKSRNNTLNSSSSSAVISAPKRGASGGGGGGGGLSSSPSSSSSFSMGPSFDNSSSNLSSFSSHVDLFLSCSQTKPSRRVFTWGNFSTSRNKVLEISQSDPVFPAENELGTRVFYASIEAYSSDPSEPAPPLAYTISAEVVPRVQSDISSSSVSAQVLTSSLSAVIPNGTIVDSKSRSLSQSSSSSSSSSLLSASASAPTTASASESFSVNPPSRSLSSSSNSSSSSSSSSSSMPRSICKNCQQLVPTTTLAMHEPFCVRNNWRCDVCNAVIQMKMKASHMHCKECILVCSSTDEMRKHMEVLHSSHKCENGCGTRLVGPESHETHIRSECDLRQVNCLYCNMSLSFRTRFDHEKMCGGRTTQCDICNKNVVRMKLEMHKASGCSRHSSTPSISSSIRSSSTAAAAQIPSFALDGLEEGGGPLGLAASMFDSVFAAETGIGRGLLSGTLSSSPRFNIPPAAPSSSPRSNPVRLVSSVPYPSMTSRSRDTGGDDGGSDIEYNYDDDTYNDDEEEENEDNEGVGQNGEDHEQEEEEEEDEESRAARLEYDTASRAQWEREALQRKERADAATAAAQSAVSCPSCDRQLPSFDDLTIHLLSSCSKRATQEHAAIVSNLLGEEAVNAIAHIEDDLRADVATTAAAASSSFTDDKSSLPSSSSSSLATATATTTGQDDVAQTSSLATGEGFSTATQSESVTAPSNPPAVLGQRSDATADNGQSVSSSSSIGQLPPPRRARRMLQCPCCFMIFDSSVNEDDVQVHVLTECPSPWTDVERALKWIKPAPEGTVATNSRTVVSSIPKITSPSSSSSSSSTSSSLSFAPHALTSSVIATSTDRGKDSTTITSSSFSTIDFPNPRSANMASGGSSRVEAAAEDDISLLLPRQSSRVISSSSSSLSSSSSSSSFSKRIAEFREPQPESIVSSSLRPSIFSSLVEDDDDEVDDDDSDVDKVKNDDASVKAAVTAAAVSSGPQEHSSLSRPSFPLPTDSGNSALFNAQCPSCGERMTMNEDDDMQLHMLTSCPNAEENAKTLFG